MGAAEHPGEVAGIRDPHASCDLGDRELGSSEQRTRLGHPAFDDPLDNGATGATTYDGHFHRRSHDTRDERLAMMES